MLHNVTKMTEIALNFHKSKKFFFSKEFYVDKEIGRAYTSFLRRDVAQSGSALEWGSRGRRFKSFHPDQKAETPRDLRKRRSLFCFGDLPFSPLTFLVAFFYRARRAIRQRPFTSDLPAWKMSKALISLPQTKKATEHISVAFSHTMGLTRAGGWPPSR